MATGHPSKDSGIDEIRLLSIIVNHVFQRGWITEEERKKVDEKRNLKDKQVEMYDLIKNVKDYQNAVRLLCAIKCVNESDIADDPQMESDGANRTHKNTKKEFAQNYSNKKMEEYFLSKFSAMLIKKNLITSEENELFIRAKKKRCKTEKTHYTGNKTHNQHQIARNPLELGPVIRCILGFLCNYDIKTCRNVNKEWNAVGSLLLRTRSVIKICNFHRVPAKFFEIFDSAVVKAPFPVFRIFGWEQYPWTIEQLTEFFEKQQGNIRELKLEHLFLNANGMKVTSHDITPWICKSPIIQPKTKYNTKLSIDCWEKSTIMKVPLKLLVHIKDISLKMCSLYCNEGIRISPINLELDSVMFYEDANSLPQVLINDIVDFSRMKSMKLLANHSLRPAVTTLTLDLDGKEKLNLEELELSKVAAINWRKSNWKINKLTLYGLPFLEKTQMQITELDFQTTMFSEKQFDLFALPDSIEILSINNVGSGTDLICTNRVALTKLKDLYLDLRHNPTIISHFKQCPVLSKMILEGSYSAEIQLQLKISWIPRSVKILKLTNLTLMAEKDDQLCLERLILNSYTFSAAKGMLSSHMQVNDVVLGCPSRWTSTWGRAPIYQVNDVGVCLRMKTVDATFLDLFQHLNSLNCYKRFYVGPYDWLENSFDESPLKPYVTRKAYYYLFENQKGKDIDKTDFEKVFMVRQKYN